MMPQYLYRGDSDLNGRRHLRFTINYGQLQTNLLNGGNGLDVFKIAWSTLVNKHVGYGWDQSSFLSFSDSNDEALRYGIGCDRGQYADEIINYSETGDDSNWKFSLIELDMTKIAIKPLIQGVYEGLYEASLNIFTKSDIASKVFFVDVVNFLSNTGEWEKYADSIENASRDNEWLILPANPILLNEKFAEFSGIFDISHIGKVTKYSITGSFQLDSFLDI